MDTSILPSDPTIGFILVFGSIYIYAMACFVWACLYDDG